MYQSSYSSYLRTCHNGLNGSVRFESNQVVNLLSPATKICALALIHLNFSTTFRTKSFVLCEGLSTYGRIFSAHKWSVVACLQVDRGAVEAVEALRLL